MTTSADGHTEKEEVQTPTHDSEPQLDDVCDSENSFGSDFGDDTTDEEKLGANADIEPELQPAYSDEDHPQSTSIPANMDRKSPLELQYSLLKFSGPLMCVVCKVSPAYSNGQVSYPTCGLKCASKFPITSSNNLLPAPPQYSGRTSSSASQKEISYFMQQLSVKDPDSRQLRGSASQMKMCDVCHVRPRVQRAGKIYPTCGFTCKTALIKRPSSKGSIPTLDSLAVSYEKLSLLDHSLVARQQPSQAHRHNPHDRHSPHDHPERPRGVTGMRTAPTDHRHRSQVHQICVVCRVNPCRDGRYVTCGIECVERLCKRGNSDPNVCDYCHRRPKVPGFGQCGNTCREKSSTACLLCRCRPKFGRYPLCGRTCKKIATKCTPLILEARPGHTIYRQVEKKFKHAWKGGGVCPTIKKIYKIIEDKSFLLPYDRYKKRVGNEVFRYHGTSRGCTLGSPGNTQVCSFASCALCSILRTSFKVSLANPNGAFGAGIYTSSAANKAYTFSNGGSGALILTKVVLGTAYSVSGWKSVRSCPSGYNSVVFDHQNGTLNETIVYSDDAIRPVFLIIF